MSHQVESLAYAYRKGSNEDAYQVPWHGLGTPVTSEMTANEMRAAAGLNWEIKRLPSFYIDPLSHQTRKLPTDVLVRDSDGKLLTGNLGKGWNPNTNKTAFDWLEKFVRKGQLEMNCAGSLRGGKLVFALAKIKESFALFNGKDQIDSYFLFSNPHIWGSAINLRQVSTRVVCSNTHRAALNETSRAALTIHHSSDFSDEGVQKKVENALGIAHEAFAEYKDAAEFLSGKKFLKEVLGDYFATVFPASGEKEEKGELSIGATAALKAMDEQPGAKLGEGTWWQALNAVTFVMDHKLGKTADARLSSAWYGLNAGRKDVALKTALELAKA